VGLPLGDSSLAVALTRHYTITTENVHHNNKLSQEPLQLLIQYQPLLK
jgi:hypothetical protein